MIDKLSEMGIGEGAVYSLVSIILVFAILLIIIGITSLIFKLTGLFDMRDKVLQAEKNSNAPKGEDDVKQEIPELDDDAMAAVLVATIDYQNEIKKDVRVVSVKKLN